MQVGLQLDLYGVNVSLEMNLWTKAASILASLKRDKAAEPPPAEEEVTVPCCSEDVHIAFRGVSDDRLYVAYRRKWHEVKYYKPNGLRVFCAECRRRLL